MESSFWFDTMNLGQSIVHIEECQVITLKKKNCTFCLKVFFTLTNCVDPDEMPHYKLIRNGVSESQL